MNSTRLTAENKGVLTNSTRLPFQVLQTTTVQLGEGGDVNIKVTSTTSNVSYANRGRGNTRSVQRRVCKETDHNALRLGSRRIRHASRLDAR